MDVIVAAQSFHWFTNRAALEEINRVLAPNGSFGMMWKIADTSIPWLRELFDFIDLLDKEHNLVFPCHRNWRKVFSLISQQLFSAPQEYIGFEYSVPSSFDHAFKLFSSYSPIAGGSEQQKIDFRKVFDDVTRKHFKDKGIHLDSIPYKIYMYWCTKEDC